MSISSKRSVAAAIFSGISGLVFGLGLIVSHMIDPQRVADFLDIAGNWNPALAFVMGAAIIVAAPAFAYARRHSLSLIGNPISLPNRFNITPRLVGGAALFGIGWGLSGICPGPAIVLLANPTPPAIIFIAGLIAGIWLTDTVLTARSSIPGAAAPQPSGD